MTDPEQRRRHWDHVYRRSAAEHVSWFQPRPELSLALIEASGVRPPAPIVDVGGGASTLVDHLLERGYTLTVLDISAAALTAAAARLGPTRAEQVTWIDADITRPELADTLGRFELWHDRAVFHFLTDAGDRRSYVATMSAALAPGGHAILATFAVGGPERCSGLPVVRYDAASLLAALGSGFDLVETREELHHTPSGAAQAFMYFLLRRRA